MKLILLRKEYINKPTLPGETSLNRYQVFDIPEGAEDLLSQTSYRCPAMYLSVQVIVLVLDKIQPRQSAHQVARDIGI